MSQVDDITFAVCSDLSGSAAAAVQHIWTGLEAHFGLRVVQAAMRPHVTYLLGTLPAPRRDALLRCIALAARQVAPFTLELEGLSSFEGPAPVLFIRAVKTAELEGIYDVLWQNLPPVGFRVDELYRPHAWVPHCTLALGDLTPELLPAVRDHLRAQTLAWRCPIRALDLIRIGAAQHEYIESWPLRGEPPKRQAET